MGPHPVTRFWCSCARCIVLSAVTVSCDPGSRSTLRAAPSARHWHATPRPAPRRRRRHGAAALIGAPADSSSLAANLNAAGQAGALPDGSLRPLAECSGAGGNLKVRPRAAAACHRSAAAVTSPRQRLRHRMKPGAAGGPWPPPCQWHRRDHLGDLDGWP